MGKMEDSKAGELSGAITFKTRAGNQYLHSRQMNQFLLMHPVVNEMIRLEKKGIDPEQWYKTVPEDGVEIESCGHVTKEEVEYYYRKYMLLSENGYFSCMDNQNKIGGRLTPGQIYSLLANCRNLVFEVTDACNLECEYCGYREYYSGYDPRSGKHMDINLARNMLEYLLGFWNSPLNESHNVVIQIGFYGGEPLLNIDFIKEVVDLLKHHSTSHNKFVFGMTTNALLLDRHMDFLAENDFELLLSLDGDKDANAYRVRRSGKHSFEQVFQNARALMEKHPDYFKHKVNFSSVLHNKNSVEKVFSFFKANFDKIPQIANLSPVGIAPEKADEFKRTFGNADSGFLEPSDCSSIEEDVFLSLPDIEDLAMAIWWCSGYSFKDFNTLLDRAGHQKKIPTGSCLPFYKKIFLTVNGKMLPCERIGQKYDLGRVDGDGVTLDVEEIARKMNALYDGIRGTCASCYAVDTCRVCIFQMEERRDKGHCPSCLDSGGCAQFLSSGMSKLEEHPEYYWKIMDEVVTGGI